MTKVTIYHVTDIRWAKPSVISATGVHITDWKREERMKYRKKKEHTQEEEEKEEDAARTTRTIIAENNNPRTETATTA